MTPKRRQITVVWPWLLVVPVLAGCPAPPPRYPIREPSRIVQVMRERDARLNGLLRAEGSIDQFGQRGRFRGGVTIFVRRPDRLRVSTMVMNNVVASLVVADGQLRMFQGQQYI